MDDAVPWGNGLNGSAPSPCPVCTNIQGNLLLEHRPKVPTLQNTALATVDQAIAYPSGQLDMVRCAACSFVWNNAFDDAAIDYDDNYDNGVFMSGFYMQHMRAMADRVIASVPADEPIHYVEVGCGDADFLKMIVEKSEGRCKSAIGFDPSFTAEGTLPDCAVIHKSFFGPEKLHLISEDVNVICSRHTIEHVADAQAFASALVAPMTKPGRRLLIETPDADWILKNAAFQDFFYEHCSLFTPGSIGRLLAAHGLTSDVTLVYGDQYMWIDASLDPDGVAPNIAPEEIDASLALARDYVEKHQAMIADWSDYLKQRSASGPVAIWGAASKGVTFNLLFANHRDFKIDCAIDLNAAKQGRFLPATGLAVVDPEEAKRRGVATVIVMNPNYEMEIREMAKRMDWDPEFSVLNG